MTQPMLEPSEIFGDVVTDDSSDAVRWNEERNRTLFDLGPLAVYSCDAAGVIQEFNHRAVELWGREPLVGDTDKRFCGSFKLFRPDGSFMPHEQCPMAEVLAGTLSEACDAEVVIQRPDGSRITVIVNIRSLKDEGGDIIGALNCFYDITASKETEEALRDSDRRKNEFLAMLAHELRNPLAPICNSLEVMRRLRKADATSSLSSPAKHALDAAMDVLERQVGHMVRLVDDLLDAGRISRGKMVLRRERVELSSVIYHAVESVQALSVSLQQELTVTLPQAPVYVNADPTRLAQIVGNLLNNACKFTDRGGRIWLTVDRAVDSGAETEDTPNARAPSIVIRVRDTGLGIAADQLARIFDMFTQVDTALERSVSGLGIGLTLVRTLTQMHGGTVEVTSAGLGHGSEFIVRLPIVVDTPQEVRRLTTGEPVVTTAALRILVVDDNHDAAEMLARLLEFSGHETYTAHDGMDAVEAAEKLQPDVILLDIGLPRLNGYDAARMIRKQNTHGAGPVLVALTGWGQEEDRQRSEEAGFHAHFLKPVDEIAIGKLLDDLGTRKQEAGI
jgi:signal transduction histidine kinase